MENESAERNEFMPESPRYSRKFKRALIVVVCVLVVAAVGYIVVSKLTAPAVKNDSTTEKVLTLSDLDNAATSLTPQTSNASVENLMKELKAKIDTQIANKENPITTVRTLAGVLCSTVNADRPTQCVDYIKEFLDTKMDSLKVESDEYGQPDELQISFWRAQFYSDLIYNYEFIMNNKLNGSDGKPLNTTAEQLKYINLYLEVAQNPANWGEPQISIVDGHTWYNYDYKNTTDFIERRKQLETGDAQ